MCLVRLQAESEGAFPTDGRGGHMKWTDLLLSLKVADFVPAELCAVAVNVGVPLVQQKQTQLREELRAQR